MALPSFPILECCRRVFLFLSNLPYKNYYSPLILALGAWIANGIAQSCRIDPLFWRRFFVIPSSVFSKNFLNSIEKSNQLHPDAPLALIVLAEKDDSRALSDAASQHLILQAAKTHQIALKWIDKGFLLGPTIRETAKQYRKAIDSLIIMAHGSPRSIVFGSFGLWNWFPHCTSSDLKESDFSAMTKNGRIILDSCTTGCGFAQEIAVISKRSVLAPVESSIGRLSVYSQSKRGLKLISFNEEGRQIIHEFYADQTSKPISSKGIEHKKALFEEKISYFEKMAKEGDASAQFYIALAYHTGLGGVGKSEEKAYFWGALAAKQGCPRAQVLLGIHHFFGLGHLERSEEKAAYWFRLSAEQGLKEAQTNLAIFYSNGMGGIKRSDTEALRWLRLAVKQGCPRAQSLIGSFYWEGRADLKPCEKEALKWFRLAAEQGEKAAQLNLGIFYWMGHGGVEASDSEAYNWFLKAANQGSVSAQWYLGLFHEEGIGGVEKSKEIAIEWFLKAASGGHPEAKAKLDLLRLV